jgi:hypothetical protein
MLMNKNITQYQSGNGLCNISSASGGGLMSDLEKQFKSLISSTKKTVKGVKRKITGTKRKTTKKKCKTCVVKKPVKRKSTVAKKKPVKRKSTVAKKKPVKRKSTVAKKKPVKRGGGGRPLRYYSGGDASTEQANHFAKSLKMMGGGSSDFIGTLSSRGPVNYTNSEGSGLSGEQLFRTFNKTGTYMPHDKVNYGSVLPDGILGHKLTGGGRKYVKRGG